MAEEINLIQLADELENIYQNFTDEIQSMGTKKGMSRLGRSALHWLAGSHVRTERDVACENFISDVQKQLEIIDMAMEGSDEQEINAVCMRVAEILSTPVPANSNATTDLMKRAMLSKIKPYLQRLSKEQLEQIRRKIEAAYSKRQRLPIETEVLKEISAMLG